MGVLSNDFEYRRQEAKAMRLEAENTQLRERAERAEARLAEYDRDADWSHVSRALEIVGDVIQFGAGPDRSKALHVYQALCSCRDWVGRWRGEADRINAALTESHEVEIARLRERAERRFGQLLRWATGAISDRSVILGMGEWSDADVIHCADLDEATGEKGA